LQETTFRTTSGAQAASSTGLTTCVICTRSAAEALQIAVGGQNKVCSVVTTEETFEIRRKNLNEII